MDSGKASYEHIRLEWVRSPSIGVETLAKIRSVAWNSKYPNYAVQIADWSDEFEEESDHLIAKIGGKIAGAARLNYLKEGDPHTQFGHVPGYLEFITPKKPPFAVFSRMAVLPEYRGRGVAAILDAERVNLALSKGCTIGLIEVRAQSPRLNAITSIGFKSIPGAENYPAAPFLGSPAKALSTSARFLLLDSTPTQ